MSMNDFVKMLSNEQRLALLKALQNDSPALSEVPKEVKQDTIKQIENSTQKDQNNVSDDFKVSSIKKNNKRREPVRGRENRWKDEGEFRDIETPKVDRVARNRPAHKKAEVECSVCGKPFKVDPKYIYGEYHRCNRCVGR